MSVIAVEEPKLYNLELVADIIRVLEVVQDLYNKLCIVENAVADVAESVAKGTLCDLCRAAPQSPGK